MSLNSPFNGVIQSNVSSTNNNGSVSIATTIRDAQNADDNTIVSEKAIRTELDSISNTGGGSTQSWSDEFTEVTQGGWYYKQQKLNGFKTDIAAKKFQRVSPLWFSAEDPNNGDSPYLVLNYQRANNNPNGAVLFEEGLSEENTRYLRKYSPEIYPYVSEIYMGAFYPVITGTERTNALLLMRDVLKQNSCRGIRLNIEGFNKNAMTQTQYQAYPTFVQDLSNEIYPLGYDIILDLAAEWENNSDGNPWSQANAQNYYWVDYAELAAIKGVKICIMAYDYLFDYGVGTAQQPLQWLRDIIRFALKKIPREKLIIGIPTFVQSATTGTYGPVTVSHVDAITTIPGFPGVRDPFSAEMKFTNGATTYHYCDDEAINQKIQVCKDEGVMHVDFFGIGGNRYGTKKSPFVMPHQAA